MVRAIAICVITLTSITAVQALAKSPRQIAYFHVELTRRLIGSGSGSGSGVLFYKGHRHRYRLLLSGIKLDTIRGVVDLDGKTINLRTPEDIQGTYYAESEGPAVVTEQKVVRMKNEFPVKVLMQRED